LTGAEVLRDKIRITIMITELHLHNVGPALTFDIEFKKRLNLLASDNGPGKSDVLLDKE